MGNNFFTLESFGKVRDYLLWRRSVSGMGKVYIEFPLPELLPPWDELAERMAVLLRLAVLLRRTRSDAPLPPIRLAVRGRGLVLKFPRGWLRANPLTAADLEQEARYLAPARYRLGFS